MIVQTLGETLDIMSGTIFYDLKAKSFYICICDPIKENNRINFKARKITTACSTIEDFDLEDYTEYLYKVTPEKVTV